MMNQTMIAKLEKLMHECVNVKEDLFLMVTKNRMTKRKPCEYLEHLLDQGDLMTTKEAVHKLKEYKDIINNITNVFDVMDEVVMKRATQLKDKR